MAKITQVRAVAGAALFVLSLSVAVYAQAPSSEEEALAEALGALRESAAETAAAGLPESAEAAQAREACRLIPNPTARAICTGVLGMSMALDVGVPTIVGWITEDGEEMTQEQQAVLDRLDDLEEEQQAVLDRLDDLEEWRKSTDDRLSNMDGKLDVIIELLR